MVPDQSILDLW